MIIEGAKLQKIWLPVPGWLRLRYFDGGVYFYGALSAGWYFLQYQYLQSLLSNESITVVHESNKGR